jgi:hypothetical protein
VLKANTHNIMMFTNGTNASRQKTPGYPALLTIFQAGITYTRVTDKNINQ